jgi:hypothetical protein
MSDTAIPQEHLDEFHFLYKEVNGEWINKYSKQKYPSAQIAYETEFLSIGFGQTVLRSVLEYGTFNMSASYALAQLNARAQLSMSSLQNETAPETETFVALFTLMLNYAKDKEFPSIRNWHKYESNICYVPPEKPNMFEAIHAYGTFVSYVCSQCTEEDAAKYFRFAYYFLGNGYILAEHAIYDLI